MSNEFLTTPSPIKSKLITVLGPPEAERKNVPPLCELVAKVTMVSFDRKGYGVLLLLHFMNAMVHFIAETETEVDLL